MKKSKRDYPQTWNDLANEALEQAKNLGALGRYNEALRKIKICSYCHDRFIQAFNLMLTRKQDRISNVTGAIFSALIVGALIYLIIKKQAG